MKTRPISKTDYLAGIQCPLRLWNRHHAPIPNDDQVTTPAMRVGVIIGRLARQLFPGGILVEAAPWEREAAVKQTKALLASPNVATVFEAGFLHNDLHARVDVLTRRPSGAMALYEVKGTGEVKAQHIPDLAFQLHVVRASGIEVDEVGIIHINKQYERQTEVDVSRLFSFSDQTEEVNERLASIQGEIEYQREIVRNAAPYQEPDGRCHDPYPCEFWERCTQCKPDDWIYYLPRLKGEYYDELQLRRIETIPAIPEEFQLSELQNRIRDVLRTGKAYIGTGLNGALAELTPPVSFLDFETINPAIPIWPGTHPFERIPFQWSVHRRTDSGLLTHAEFLADGLVDPRRELTEALIRNIERSNGRIVVYNKAFEHGVLCELAHLYPSHSAKLLSIADRLWDLLPVVRNNVYLPQFRGSFSIKSVAPALAPTIDYARLGLVTNGGEASDTFIRIVTGTIERALIADMRKSLLRYCFLDTLAMVEICAALGRLTNTVAATGPQKG